MVSSNGPPRFEQRDLSGPGIVAIRETQWHSRVNAGSLVCRSAQTAGVRALYHGTREATMSELNGDKARFQRLRKAGLLRREKARATWAEMKRRNVANRGSTDGEQTGGARGRLETLHPETRDEAVAE